MKCGTIRMERDHSMSPDSSGRSELSPGRGFASLGLQALLIQLAAERRQTATEEIISTQIGMTFVLSVATPWLKKIIAT